ncbi:MAG: hypothetical protein MUE69_02420 [Myxococcota bacterium]|nr:hypothetical protein [Myxococcota bacterium]
MTRWVAGVVLLVACGGGGSGGGASTVPARWHSDFQHLSAGWLGCPAEEVVVEEAQRASWASSWRATCGDLVMICSSGYQNSTHCAPLHASTPEPTRTESPLVIRDLPPEVAECIERPVAVEVLFGGDGRLSELRPWPGETPEQRRCVERVLVEIDAPTGTGGPVLVRFEPRDPWQGTSGGER